LQLIAEYADDVLVRAGLDGKIIYVSPNVASYGYDPQELVGSTGAQIIHPDEVERFSENGAALLRGEFNPESDRRYRIRTKGGEWRWVEANPRITLDEHGSPMGFINVFRNVTGRASLDDAVLERAKLYEAAFNHSATGKIVLGLDGRILRVNSALLSTLNYKAEDLIGRRDDDFAHPDEIGKFSQQYFALLAGEIQSYTLKRRYLRGDGVYIWCTLIVALGVDASGFGRRRQWRPQIHSWRTSRSDDLASDGSRTLSPES